MSSEWMCEKFQSPTYNTSARMMLFISVFGAVICLTLHAQSQAEQRTFRVSVNLVQVEVVVTDSAGHHYTALEAQDFDLLEDGRAQNIVGCSYVRIGTAGASKPISDPSPLRDPRAPPAIPRIELTRERVRRTIVLLVDDGSLLPQTVPTVQTAIRKIINEQLQPEDLVAIVRSSSGEGALQQFTSNKGILLAAADRIRWAPQGGIGSGRGLNVLQNTLVAL